MTEARIETAKIMVVDDEPANVRLLERILEQAGYASVTGITDSRQVVPRYREIGPDLILLDLMMPHLDGMAVMVELEKHIPPDDYLPILVLTADVTVEAKRRALAAGARDFLTKPFDQVEVLLRIRNLLEARFLHQSLRRHSEELERLVEERTRQLLQTEKLAAMGTLLAGVAHELNNPLSVVLGQAAILREQAGDDRTRARADKIGKGADRCARIVRNFLAMARQRKPERQPVALNHVVEEALELLAYPLRVDSVEVERALSPGLPEIQADPHQLGQVFVNLISNAHQAMRGSPEPRRLAVATGWDGERSRVVVEIADSGPGISAEMRERIFEPFFTTKPAGEGTGLGLYLCHNIVAEHGGSVAVVDGREPGATFRIELPAGASAVAGERAPEVAASRPARAGNVLVVDDERGIAEILQEFLSGEGHQVEVAGDGLEALDKLATRAFDAVLVDMKMPGLDGPGLYREAARRDPAIVGRMVFMTGDELGEQSRRFIEDLGVRPLSKPFDLRAVSRAVAETITAGDQAPARGR